MEKVGVQNPFGNHEQAVSTVAHAHARAKGIELAGGLGKMSPHRGMKNSKTSLGRVLFHMRMKGVLRFSSGDRLTS
jgi:hypothetical protein